MNFGIIGFGNIAHKFIQSITSTDEGRVTAIASRSVPENDPYLAAHPQVKLYRDYETLLQDPQVEAVYIALTHKYHKEWILRAMDYHIPVLCEKPLVLSSKDAAIIRTKGKDTGTYCLEALKTKFNDGFQHLKKDLPLIGQIRHLKTSFCSDASGMPPSCFLFDPEQGGALNDIGSYALGFILGLCEDPITNVKSTLKVREEIEEYFSADLVFSGGYTAFAEGAIDRRTDRTALIQGTKGKIEVPLFNRISSYTITLQDGSVIRRENPILGDDMTMEIQAAIQDIKSGKTESSVHSLEDTKNILILSEKIREAAQTAVSSSISCN